MEEFLTLLAGFIIFAWVGDTSEHHKIYRIFNAPPGLGISDIFEGMADMNFTRMLIKGVVGALLTMLFYYWFHHLAQGEIHGEHGFGFAVSSVMAAYIAWKVFAIEVIYDAAVRKKEAEDPANW